MVDVTEWHEEAVVYTLDVKTFYDADGDGWGDFRGVTERLDYVAELGVDCLWLRPFYPSPLRDNGYDVADYRDVDDRLGTLAEFEAFTDAAHDRGIRVLTDLVFNHTSVDHEWFQTARRDPDSEYHDYYLWTSHPEEAYSTANIFPEFEDGVWSYDEVAEKWYFHQFYSHQPDLNVANPAVRDELHEVLRFWLDKGVDGFRVDAAHPMTLPKGHHGHEEGIWLFEELREVVKSVDEDAILLAEADDEPHELPQYFADGDAFDLLFDFVTNAHLTYAVGVRDTWPLHRANEVVPDVRGVGGWANFLRNHDEWNLLKLPDEALEHARECFGPDDGASWIFERGHRLRLADLYDHDHDRLAMAHSLLLSYPGTPVLLSGDEIGMGADLSLPEREAVRTPMQWGDGPDGGFSAGDPAELYNPVVTEGPARTDAVNVAAQRADPDSLLSRVRRLIAARSAHADIARGDFRILDTDRDDVFVHRVDTDAAAYLFAHNLAPEYREPVVGWEVPEDATERVSVGGVAEGASERVVSDRAAGDESERVVGDGGAHVEDGSVTFLLDPHDYVWLRGA